MECTTESTKDAVDDEMFKERMRRIHEATNEDGSIDVDVIGMTPNIENEEVEVTYLTPQKEEHSEKFDIPRVASAEYPLVRLLHSVGLQLNQIDQLTSKSVPANVENDSVEIAIPGSVGSSSSDSTSWLEDAHDEEMSLTDQLKKDKEENSEVVFMSEVNCNLSKGGNLIFNSIFFPIAFLAYARTEDLSSSISQPSEEAYDIIQKERQAAMLSTVVGLVLWSTFIWLCVIFFINAMP